VTFAWLVLQALKGCYDSLPTATVEAFNEALDSAFDVCGESAPGSEQVANPDTNQGDTLRPMFSIAAGAIITAAVAFVF